jgi:DNA-binding ferritin-like protein
MKLITPFVTLQEQLRVFHWQSETYGQHKAFGKAYDNLGDLIDQFVEVYSGKYGKPKAKLKYSISLSNFEGEYSEFIDSSIVFLDSLNAEFDGEKDSDLLNIRDEMKAELNRLKYLLTLR